MNLAQSVSIPSTLAAPRFIFTCYVPHKLTRSLEVIAALRELEKTSPITRTSLLIRSEHPKSIPLPMRQSVALFDGFGQGFYSLRHTRKFRRITMPSWVAAAQWSVCIHEGQPDRIAEQLHVLFGEKFFQSVERGQLPTIAPPKKKRPPRTYRNRRDRWYTFA